MHCRIFLLSAWLTGMVLSVPAGQKELPGNMSFSDENTGVVFPPALGSFRKTEIRINPNPVIGTRIQYAGGQVGCSADIYIYALTETPTVISLPEFLNHYRDVRRKILELKSVTKRVEEVESVRQFRFSGKGGSPALRERFQLRTDGEETYQSELLLILYGDRVIKLRITAPAALLESVQESEQFILAFCRLFFKEQPTAWTPVEPDRPDKKTGK